jgi:hypothetical protein
MDRIFDLERTVQDLVRRVTVLESKQPSVSKHTAAIHVGSHVIIMPGQWILHISNAVNDKIGSNLVEINYNTINQNIQTAFVVIQANARLSATMQVPSVANVLSELQRYPSINVYIIVLHLNQDTQVQNRFENYELIHLYSKPKFGPPPHTVDFDSSLDIFNRNGFQRLRAILGLPLVGCEYCYATMGNLLYCGACQQVAYCSKECQEKHWMSHSRQCNT